MRIFGARRTVVENQEKYLLNKEEETVSNAYRDAFSTPHGQIVLDDILLMLCFFDEAVDDEMRVKQNIARVILNKLGIFNEVKSGEVVKQLLTIRTPLEKLEA